MYPVVNRAVILVKPKKPFMDWAKYVNTGDELSNKEIEEALNEYNAYLIKEIDYDEEFEKIIKKESKNIFENELAGWSQDESEWPTNRSYKIFRELFEIIDSIMVVDTDTSFLEREEEEDEEEDDGF